MGRKARDEPARPATRNPSRESPHPAASPAHDAGGSSPAAPTARTLLWAAALVLATVAVYAGALDNPFLLDDPISITKNPVIQRPLDLAALAADPRAVVTLSLRWNWIRGGADVAGYHLLNVAAHALAGLLVFALARTALMLRDRPAAIADHLAGLAAIVFLLHPIQTESVTYVIQRAEIFVSATLVGALLALSAMRDRVSAGAMGLLALSCAVGVYSKPSFAVAPALLLAFDVLVLASGGLRDVARRWPVYALSTAAAAATFAITKAHGSFSSSTAGFDIEGITPLGYLAAQPGVIVQYLRVTLWPSSLCFDCGYRGPWPVLATFLGDSVLVPSLILLALAGAAISVRRSRPLASFAVFGSAIVLAPTSSVVPLADFYVEHRMYLPVAFLAMALVPMAHDLLEAGALRLRAPRSAAPAAAIALASAVVLALGAATIRRNELLADPIALMQESVRLAPQNERAQYNLANYYKREGRLDEAIPHYEAAIRLLPNVVRSYQNLGSLYLQQNKPDKALEVYLAGAAAKPEMAMAHRNVANTYLQLGRPAEALAAAERAIAIDPRNANGRRLAGDALLALGRAEEAVAQWRAGIEAAPGDPALAQRLSRFGQR